jgi:diketogulonate reductase-like aldo/keto reductase
MSVPDITLADGNTIPQLGLGTWQSKDEEAYKNALKEAFKSGYRHIDTAQAYGNEQMLGEAWRKSKIPREELFITTKIHIAHFGHKKLHDSFDESLKKLQTDYVDLLLLHFPVPVLRKKAWQMLEDINVSGLAKSIGVSNYTIKHLEELKNYAKIIPAINQVELHVFLQQPDLIKYCRDNGIQVEAYSPLARGRIMDNDVVKRIADKHDKTYAQVMLRWLVEQDLVVIPKSVTPNRIDENIDIFDFELDKEDMKAIAGIDMNKRFCWSPVNVP